MKYLPHFTITILSIFLASSIPAEVRRYDGTGAVEIHVRAIVKPNHTLPLQQTFREYFHPAISKQEGFLHCDLLHTAKSKNAYVLTIAFKTEELRVTWANSPLHQKVWPKMQEHFKPESMAIDAFGLVSPKLGPH
jgi:heme-degrading monooxygenase HmoA